MRTIVVACIVAIIATVGLTGCATAPKTEAARVNLEEEVQTTVTTALKTDADLRKFFDTSAGYAVFPTVGKGAVGVGGAFGRGILFENGQATGYVSLTQGTVGLALGGQSFSELIFFETPEAVDRFKRGELTFTAQASAVALRAGASAAADYANNVAVFTMDEAGLMVEASIGGQKFNYEPIGTTSPVRPAMSTQ